MNIREKLAKLPIWMPEGEVKRTVGGDLADQQIAIFKEMLDTMEMPQRPSWIFPSNALESYDVAQQDLLKAIKEECDK